MQDKLTLFIKENYQADICVAGGGVAGCSAALAAARKGKKVILCEKEGCLGGAAVLGCVAPLGSKETRDGRSFGGILEELVVKLEQWNRKYANADGNTIINPHLLQLLLMKELQDAGVKLLFHVEFCQCQMCEEKIQKAFFLSGQGILAVEAEIFIDATGDGALFAAAGADYVTGSEENVFEQLFEANYNKIHYEKEESLTSYGEPGAVQPASAMFLMGGVDIAKGEKYCNRLLTYEDLGITKEEFMTLPYAGSSGFEKNENLIPLPQGRILFYLGTRKGEVVVNMSRVLQVDVEDTQAVSEAERVTQLQVLYLTDFLKRFVPGFENAYFMECSVSLGIRESRRLKGKKVLKGLDAIRCKTGREDIAYASYMIDIHDPYGKRKAIGGDLKGACFGVPYDCLVSGQLKNLLVCGRCISVDHIAHASTRIQGTCIQTGQAAGTAAAVCIEEKTGVGEINVASLRKILKSDKMLIL